MLNHARTLLMNVDGGVPFLTIPGEELADPQYRALPLPSYLVSLRNALFGSVPDRHMLNYRCWQYLAILHSTFLEPYLRVLDPRITYDFATSPFVRLKAVTVLQSTGTADDQLTIVGANEPSPDLSGQMHQQFNLSLPDSATIAVAQQTAPILKSLLGLTITNGLSTLLPLGASGYQFYLTTNNVSQNWLVDIIHRPQEDLGQITANLAGGNQAALNTLFGVEDQEPFYTCRNLWSARTEVPLKLGSLLLAMIYRLELLRRTARG